MSVSNSQQGFAAKTRRVEAPALLALFNQVLACENFGRTALVEEPELEAGWLLFEMDNPACGELSKSGLHQTELNKCRSSNCRTLSGHHFIGDQRIAI